jgi:diaminobutyrate-2-oxoglutarate transaminase
MLTDSRDILETLSLSDAPRILATPPGPRSRALLERQDRRESSARTYPRGLPIAPAEARGATIKDVDGNVFIDCLAGAGVLGLGHNNPYVLDAVRRFLESGHVVNGLDFPTEIKDRFVESLFSVLPARLRDHGRIQFCGPTGSDAVDAALKLCKTATGRHEVLAFQGAYHGMGQGPMSLMGATAPKRALGALLAGAHFMPYGYCVRCPLKLTLDRCGFACAHFVGSVLADSHSGVTTPAAIIVEAVQGEGGTVVPPDGWLRTIAQYARAADVPLICDEIQSGLGRTGRWFAFEHEDVVPDVVLLSKGLSGLGLPLSVIVYHERFDRWLPGAHAGTFRGNQMAMAAGIAAIEFMRTHGIVEHAAELGARLLADLRGALGSSALVRDIRGRGLMIGLEMASSETAQRMREACLRRGLIVELGGRDDTVMRLLPPLVLTDGQALGIVEILAEAERALSRSAERASPHGRLRQRSAPDTRPVAAYQPPDADEPAPQP